MSRQFVFARLPLHSAEQQKDLLAVVKPVTAFALTGEPGVCKYASLQGTSAGVEHAVYMIEEYDDQAASDNHMATPGVKKFIEWMGVPGHVNGAPLVLFTDPTELVHAAPELAEEQGVKDAYVVVNVYKFAGGATNALSHFKAPFEAAKQRGALLYGVYTDRASADTVLTAEVYGSASEYVGPAATAQGQVEVTAVLAVHDGFLHKRSVKSSL
ncbi:hypothetical protein SCUCBS95973_006010 [Sporothrix curviconia]|uniref:ABM domain-containing protein n=1 Tax=Sporothrix curviconia TaxID=1260050 RepID=A0ABP0C3V7_9PEZI